VGIGANKLAGDSIRDVIAAREAPALIEQSFTTVGGVRRVDVLKLGDQTLAIESKVGRPPSTHPCDKSLPVTGGFVAKGKSVVFDGSSAQAR
jgi:hypothetical protein